MVLYFADSMIDVSYVIMLKNDHIVVIHSESNSTNELLKIKAEYSKQGYKGSEERYVEINFSSVITGCIEAVTPDAQCKHPINISPKQQNVHIRSLRQGRVEVITFIYSPQKSSTSYLEYHLRGSDNTVIHKCPIQVEIPPGKTPFFHDQ